MQNGSAVVPWHYRAREGIPQWFRAEEKEKQGFLESTAWEQINPSEVTPEIRKRALRCHHIYDIKRDSSAKIE